MTSELKPDQIKQLKDLFSLCDRNGDGKLTGTEFESILKTMGFMTENELKLIVKKATEQTGQVDYPRYIQEMTKLLRQEVNAEGMQESMAAFEFDERLINVEEWKKIMIENTSLTNEDVSFISVNLLTTQLADILKDYADVDTNGNFKLDAFMHKYNSKSLIPNYF
jgi:calmodulin